MPPEISAIIRDYGIWGAILAFGLLYHKPILGALTRVTRDPLIDTVMAGMNAQTEQFRANNALFHQVVGLLTSIDTSHKASLAELEIIKDAAHELLSVQRHILTETKVAAEIARGRKA